MSDLLQASLAALGAVIGLILGLMLGSILSWAILGAASDVIPMVVGGLGGALALGWLGLRLSRRFTSRPVTPSKG